MADFFKKNDTIKVPENYEWEVHNLHAYGILKEKVARGEKTLQDLKEFEHKYRESEEQREWRWRREHVLRDIEINTAKQYRDFKDNPKNWLKKMLDMGKAINSWWLKRPMKAAGKGRLYQNPITGAWNQEYKPSKSMRMRDWLAAANDGKVMRHMNPKGKSLDREPTEIEKGIAEEARVKRGKKVYQWLLNETNNFGRGFQDPKWGKVKKSEPGRGGKYRKPGVYNIK